LHVNFEFEYDYGKIGHSYKKICSVAKNTSVSLLKSRGAHSSKESLLLKNKETITTITTTELDQ
jgi:hypothetical protein